jgi:hypothetical protein
MSTRRWTYQLHRWVGIVSCLFMLLVSSTAIALNHSDVWRGWLLKPQASKHFDFSQAKVITPDPLQQGHFLAADTKALFESRDNGKTWQEMKLYLPAENVKAIVFGPQNSDKIWVALKQVGIFYSEDGGDIWEEMAQLPFNPITGETIENLWVGAGPTLFVKTSLSTYLKAAEGQWQRQTVVKIQGQQSIDIQDWIWRLHTGRFGPNQWGIYLYDGVALSLIFLAISGLWLARRPRRKVHNKSSSEPDHAEKDGLKLG